MGRIITPGHPHFHIHKRNYLELPVVEAGCSVEGRYLLQRIKPGFGVIDEVEFPNLFTNVGLNSLGSDVMTMQAVHVGTGTATPNVTDTALTAFGVGFNTDPTVSGGNAGSPNYYVRRTYSWTSTIGGATGTWTEVGVSNQATTGNLRSKALILDGGGSPSSFPVLADEQLRVFYMLDVYPMIADDTRTVSISGVAYDTITRGYGINEHHAGSNGISPSGVTIAQAYSGNIVNKVSGTITGTLGTMNKSGGSYSGGNYYRDFSLTAGAGTATGTVRTIMADNNNYDTNMRIQIQYDKASGGGGIVKSGTQQLILNIRRSWARR